MRDRYLIHENFSMLKWLDDDSFAPKKYVGRSHKELRTSLSIFAMSRLNPLKGRPCRTLTFLPI